MSISKLILALTLLFMFPLAQAQTQLKAVPGDGNSILIEGTSNIHDWEIQVDKFESTLDLLLEADIPQRINSFKLSIPVKSFNSGKSKMDKNTYKALDADTHERILFTSSKSTPFTKKKEKTYHAILSGSLSIAGRTKQVEIPIELEKTSKGFTLKAEQDLNMSNYGIEPPTALFGTITTGEEVNIIFNLLHK